MIAQNPPLVNRADALRGAVRAGCRAAAPLPPARPVRPVRLPGRRRLRPIIMTSLTTIFGMVPLLFSFDIGSELQKPLSIAMIAAMLIGTMVSLFIIPLVYWYIYRREEA